MSYQALYRKWRPAVFEEMVGQDAVVTTLQKMLQPGSSIVQSVRLNELKRMLWLSAVLFFTVHFRKYPAYTGSGTVVSGLVQA